MMIITPIVNRLLIASAVVLAMLAVAVPSSTAQESWTPSILERGEPYLPDFSYAGFRWGEEPYPAPDHVLDVTDYGAVPDDTGDDTAALRAALAAADNMNGTVAVEFPAGRFLVSEIVFIERGDLIIRGAGSGGEDGTEIHIPRPMAQMDLPPLLVDLNEYLRANDKKQDGEWFSPFSWTGGILWTRNPHAPFEKVTEVRKGQRGRHTLVLEDATGIRPGQTLRIRWYNREGDDSPILRHIYEMEGIAFGARLWEAPDIPIIHQDVRVTAVDGTEVKIKEPLLHDIREEWHADAAAGSQLENLGFEKFSVTFPGVEYGGHHLEHGHNAFYLTGIRHGWMQDIEVRNADSAILSDDASAITLEDIRLTGRRSHYAFHLGRVHHVLVRNFEIETHAYHSLSFNTGSRASVFTDGFVYRPTLDQHRGLNHQNLFDNVRALEDRQESELLVHGGARYWGPTHGAFNTFWNVQVDFEGEAISPVDTVDLGTIRDGGSVRIVGLTSNRPITLEYEPNAYLEGIGRKGIAVPSLYRYQFDRRQSLGSH